MRSLLVPILLGITAMNPGQTSEPVQTPAPGSPQRQAILDAARQPAEKELGGPVQFVVKQLREQQGWAFVHATMQQPDGQPVDYRGTRYADAAKRGFKSDAFDALLRRELGKWQVKAYSVGPTDVAWAPWSETYGVPAALFGEPPAD